MAQTQLAQKQKAPAAPAVGQLQLTPSSGISVRLSEFEGSFEELYDQVRRGQLHLSDISLYEITLQLIPGMHLDDPQKATFEPCVRMAHLLLLKTRMLLPIEDADFIDDEEMMKSEADTEEAEELERIRQRLFGFEVYQEAGTALRERELLMRERILVSDARQLELPWDESAQQLEDISPLDLFLCFTEALERLKGDKPMELSLKESELLDDRINYVLKTVRESDTGILFFSVLIQQYRERAQMVLTFLAVIFLLARGKIIARQQNPYEDISISLKI